jgi:hypothetical protein
MDTRQFFFDRRELEKQVPLGHTTTILQPDSEILRPKSTTISLTHFVRKGNGAHPKSTTISLSVRLFYTTEVCIW